MKEEFHKNQLTHTHDCVNVPDIHAKAVHCGSIVNTDENLKRYNYLNEFDTEQLKQLARHNLGIDTAMRFQGEVDILPVDNVNLGDTYLCGDELYTAIEIGKHVVKWYKLENDIYWS